MPATAAFSVVAEDSSFTPCGVHLWLESRAEIINRLVSESGIKLAKYRRHHDGFCRSAPECRAAAQQRNSWIRHLFLQGKFQIVFISKRNARNLPAWFQVQVTSFKLVSVTAVSPGPGPKGQRTFAKNVLQFTPSSCGVYDLLVWLESRAERTNVSYRLNSAIAPDRHSASAERVDSSSALVAKISCYSSDRQAAQK